MANEEKEPVAIVGLKSGLILRAQIAAGSAEWESSVPATIRDHINMVRLAE
jgi:hypothetical protein